MIRTKTVGPDPERQAKPGSGQHRYGVEEPELLW